MPPFRTSKEDTNSSDSDSDSSSSTSSRSARSGSVSDHGVAPTPGHGIGGSDQEEDEPESPRRQKHHTPSDRSLSGSPASARSRSRSKSGPPRARSKSRSSERSSGSPARSGRSVSGSPKRGRSRSGSGRSASGSPKQGRSRSASGSSKPGRSRSGSVRSGSGSPKRGRSRSGSGRSGSGTPKRGRSRSGSGSSRSRTPSRSRSRSGSRSSVASSRSNSPGKEGRSPKSRSKSRSRSRSKSGSRSNSPASPRRGKSRDLSDNEEEEASGKRNRGGSQSDESGGSPVLKKKRNVLSSDESGGEEKEGATAEALFGDADDISSDEEREKEARSPKSPKSGGEQEDKEVSEKDEASEEEGEQPEKEEEKEEETPETRIDVEIPKITFDCGRDIHFVKLPNFLSVETRPFSADTYEDEIDEEETLDEEGRARLKLKVENTIRWREVLDKEGNTLKESNARFVKWSDGTMSLHLGSEIFDVYKQPLQGDHNHLFVRQGTGLQGQAVFRTKLTFRPHSTESFTHRKMTLSLADRSQKSSGIKVLSQVGKDPDAHRGEMIKKEEEKLRASLRKESKAKRTRERGAGRNLNTRYLEPDREDGSDDDGTISLNAIKKKFKDNIKGKGDHKQVGIYSSEDEASDLETNRQRRRTEKVRALRDSDEEEGSHDEGSQHSGRATPASDES